MTAPEHDDRLEPYRRMWVLRLLDMALDESAVGAAIDDDAPVDFGQEAVAVGAIAALRPGDLVNATTPRFRHAQQIGLGLPLGPAIAELFRTTRGGAGGSRKSGAADWKQALANESALGQSTLFALGDANAQRMAGDGRSRCVPSRVVTRTPSSSPRPQRSPRRGGCRWCSSCRMSAAARMPGGAPTGPRRCPWRWSTAETLRPWVIRWAKRYGAPAPATGQAWSRRSPTGRTTPSPSTRWSWRDGG